MTPGPGKGFGTRGGDAASGYRSPGRLRIGAARDGVAAHRLYFAAVPLIVLLASCSGDGPPPEGVDIARAVALAADDSLPVWPPADAGRPVLLYVDLSQSMRGFLDPEYRTRVRTDYRAVLDGFAARLHPARVFGFGNEVRPAEGGLRVLGDPAFYSDGNTQMEDVLRRVETDSALDSTHVIIGDGRRTDPNSANGQFEQMRGVAERWTAAGGTFIVAASHAPFTPVPSDASGCRAVAADSIEGGETCPLYAFAFVAPGDQGRMAAALAATFEGLFVTPLPAFPPNGVRLAGSSTAAITLEPAWAKNARGAPIARVRGPAMSNQPLRAQVVVDDTTSPLGRGALAALRGRRLVPQVSVRGLADDSAAVPWTESAGNGALLLPTNDPLTIDFITRGADAPRHLYRVELRPAGEPVWLETYDAEKAGDRRRTYGLGRLFEGFRALDPRASPPALRLYAVVN
jgi:hypothetical protein